MEELGWEIPTQAESAVAQIWGMTRQPHNLG